MKDSPDLPTALTGDEEWELALAEESSGESGSFAVLSPGLWFDLFPIVWVEGEDRYYRCSGSLTVQVKDLNLGKKSIEFMVLQVHVPGISLVKMQHATGTIKSASGDSMVLEKLEGLEYDGDEVWWEAY